MTKPKLPPKCLPASRVVVQLTVGQEEVIRKSHLFTLLGENVGKSVRHLVQSAVIEEAIRQGKP